MAEANAKGEVDLAPQPPAVLKGDQIKIVEVYRYSSMEEVVTQL